MDTVVQSRSRTVVIGPGRPFCVIGERINPTGRKKLQAELQQGDLSRLEIDVAQQVELAEHARSLPGVAGLHLISFRREAGIARLCQRLGIPPRAERETSGHDRPVAV